ncbi:hypothetical protein ACOJR9_11880 [Alteromonas sp. A081]|uniref:hypothetical protein n=1 Tax=Alteromonas sp. A081 TaxID=3410269 RepID=UPI003B98794C
MASDIKKQAAQNGYTTAEGLVLTGGKVTPRGKLSVHYGYDIEVCAFSQVDQLLDRPGLYQIFTDDGTPLKVGIASKLRARLRQHAKSSQKYLRFKHEGTDIQPSDVRSTRSILAKHLYFDSSIAPSFGLTTEEGRRKFLQAECYLLITYTDSKVNARELEKLFEAKRIFRYQGTVVGR